MSDNKIEKYNKKYFDSYYSKISNYTKYSSGNKWMHYLISDILKDVNNNDILSFLDIGCGQGHKTALLKNIFKNAEAMGCDFSQSAIQVANKLYGNNEDNKKGGICFMTHTVKDNSIYTNKKYDLISCFEVLEHVEDWKSLLREISNASSKYLLLSFPVGRMRKYEEQGHFRNFKRNEVEKFLISETSFVPKKIFYAGFPFWSPICRDLMGLMQPMYFNNFIEKSPDATVITKIIHGLSYILFRFFSTKKYLGDQFLGLFKKQ